MLDLGRFSGEEVNEAAVELGNTIVRGSEFFFFSSVFFLFADCCGC